MIQLQSGNNVYRYCSTCRGKMIVKFDDGDVQSFGCPDGHESLLSYKTLDGLRRYALRLFQPGMGAKENG